MKISVIIPFYNLAPYVRACLDSVLAAAERLTASRDLRSSACGLQPASIEVICVDDGSSDETPSLLDAYASTLDLRVIHKPNGGEGSARNAGLEVATGDWIAYLDGDDLWLPNMLTEAVPLLTAQADADIVNLRFAPFEDGASVSSPESGSETAVFDTFASVADKVLLEVGVYPTFFRRETLGGLRFSALPLGADRLYVARCLARARKVVMADAVVHAYRVRSGSMARAVWTSRKTNSQCDYASGALAALAGSGKSVGRAGIDYLASLWLSDVPAHVRRLRNREERRAGAAHWTASFDTPGGGLLQGRQRFVHRCLRIFARHPRAACEVAHLLRICGVI